MDYVTARGTCRGSIVPTKAAPYADPLAAVTIRSLRGGAGSNDRANVAHRGRPLEHEPLVGMELFPLSSGSVEGLSGRGGYSVLPFSEIPGRQRLSSGELGAMLGDHGPAGLGPLASRGLVGRTLSQESPEAALVPNSGFDDVLSEVVGDILLSRHHGPGNAGALPSDSLPAETVAPVTLELEELHSHDLKATQPARSRRSWNLGRRGVPSLATRMRVGPGFGLGLGFGRPRSTIPADAQGCRQARPPDCPPEVRLQEQPMRLGPFGAGLLHHHSESPKVIEENSKPRSSAVGNRRPRKNQSSPRLRAEGSFFGLRDARLTRAGRPRREARSVGPRYSGPVTSRCSGLMLVSPLSRHFESNTYSGSSGTLNPSPGAVVPGTPRSQHE